MDALERARLERECELYARYLCGSKAEPAIAAKYVEAHALGVVDPPSGATRFSRALARFARRGSFATRLADAHARYFDAAGLLRRKLVLVFALLETSARGSELVDRPTSGGPNAFVLAAALRFAAFALVFLLGLMIFLPLRALTLVGLAGAR